MRILLCLVAAGLMQAAYAAEISKPHTLTATVVSEAGESAKIKAIPKPHLLRAIVESDSEGSRDIKPVPKPHRIQAIVEAPDQTGKVNEIPKPHSLKAVVEQQASVSGTISSVDGRALSGAVASVEIEGKKYSGTSNAGGNYSIRLPAEVKLPDSAFIMAEKQGYNTASRNLGREKFRTANFTLAKASRYLVQIDQGLHHLGNDNFGGAINSRFQNSTAEGTRFEKNFELSQEQFPPHVVGARLLLNVKGAEENNPVSINGKQIGTMNFSSGDGSASATGFDLDVCNLKMGNNTVAISAVDSNANDDIDDFEFTNVQLKLVPAEEIGQIDSKQFPQLDSVSITDDNFAQPLASVEVNGHFHIKATGKSNCANARGIARVQVYLKGTSESGIAAVMLMETAPGSTEFRSVKAVSAAGLRAKEGQIIVIRSGIRGATIIVRSSKTQP